ncbi:MAG: hypothetical protein CVV21_06190 [Candidatus Goldiibacteriota bacterium HGW-Goldbacteria-1]|jgi:predicted  nucleic acid-binding Zn-ribbon protein|nr:MAG: hypothetical protein CVV21_06190 [Candidatus Goldiibacteriota bacterium HGW-Goldbacteria-1]
MPLIAIEILEEKVRELLLAVNHLHAENLMLKNEIKNLSSGTNTASPEMQYELESLRKTAEKFRQERSVLSVKISRMLEQLKKLSPAGQEDDSNG